MALSSAGGAAILRASQKDEYFIKKLIASTSDVLRLFGNKTWIKYSHFIPGFSYITYGSLTTLKSLQTLGEEYTGIIQVDDSYVKLPSKLYQIICILLHACGEPVTRKALNKVKNDVENNTELLPNAKRFLLKFIKITEWLLPILADLHQAWFYLGGQHFNISKRLTNINYVNAVPGLTFHTNMLRAMGIPCILRAILNAVKSPPLFEDIDYKDLEEFQNKTSCPGCLESNTTPCALPCGHILCNKCARGNFACPLCRSPYHPHKTVPLQNISL